MLQTRHDQDSKTLKVCIHVCLNDDSYMFHGQHQTYSKILACHDQDVTKVVRNSQTHQADSVALLKRVSDHGKSPDGRDERLL